MWNYLVCKKKYVKKSLLLFILEDHVRVKTVKMTGFFVVSHSKWTSLLRWYLLV